MSPSLPFSRENKLILGILLLLSLLSWTALFWQPASMESMGFPLTGADTLLFLSLWIVMMVAMMFPSAAPMILTFSQVYKNQRSQGKPFIPTWVFIIGYMIIWAAFGLAAYLAAGAVSSAQPPWAISSSLLAGAFLIAAGIYQLTPLKNICLSKCRSPFDFLMGSWRDGYQGAVLMGLEHGLYCLGCCWLLFLILFPLGIMNIFAMMLVTVLIFAEKAWRTRIPVSKISSVLLIASVAYLLLF